MQIDAESAMRIAIEEAKLSLREGNHGFGAIVVKGEEIITRAHDEEETTSDPTSHAELNAIRMAAGKLGKNLAGCRIVSTHEPCPMCASAIVWSGITEIAYGYSIEESLEQGRKRIGLSCGEIFARAGTEASIHAGILHDECECLYMKSVRNEMKRLRGAGDEELRAYDRESATRRTEWFRENRGTFPSIADDALMGAYRLLLCRFGIMENDAPIVKRDDQSITFHSKNFCPTLEACKILNLDTRYVCKRYNENATDTLVKQLDPRLRFVRNYEKLRPYADYCEEMLSLDL